MDFALHASAVDQECVGRSGTVEVGAGQSVGEGSNLGLL